MISVRRTLLFVRYFFILTMSRFARNLTNLSESYKSIIVDAILHSLLISITKIYICNIPQSQVHNMLKKLLISLFLCATSALYAANYLTFTAEEDGSSFGIQTHDLSQKNRSSSDTLQRTPDVQYSLDGGKTWAKLLADTLIPLKHKGDKALLRGNNPQGFSDTTNMHTQFVMTGRIAASGSVMSLIDNVGESVVIPNDYCFNALFTGCTSLTKAPELPATTLASRCYRFMFYGCTSLTKAPKLPATTLASGCYEDMFYGCTSLTTAPELLATTLDKYCYESMFYGCTSLTKAPKLPATTLKEECYCRMFDGCTSLTKAPKLPATTLASRCYDFMFYGCTSLTKAPKLPATTLKEECYYMMFYGCTSLTKAPELPATELEPICYMRMFCGCTSLTKAPELPATQLADECYSFMFYGCTSLTKAPELPATQLAAGCYFSMFEDCTSLTKAPELPATQLADACYFSMFSGCTSLTQAPELLALQLHIGSYLRMFEGCVRLSKIKVGFLDWGEIFDVRGDKFWNTDHWFDGVAPSGTFICPEELPEEFGENRIPEGWKVEKVKN